MRINASRGHPSTITMSKQGKIAYAGYKDAIVLDIEERLSPIDVVINSTNVTCLAFSSDDQYLATGSNFEYLQIFFAFFFLSDFFFETKSNK